MSNGTRDWWRGALLQGAIGVIIGLGSAMLAQFQQATVLKERIAFMVQTLEEVKSSLAKTDAQARLTRLETMAEEHCRRISRLEGQAE